MKRAWWRWGRRLVLVVVVVFVARYVGRHLGELAAMRLSVDPWRLALAGLLGLGWVVAQSVLWRLVLWLFGAHVDVRHAVAQVWFANLGKYLPGKVWAAVGRVYMCRLSGVAGSRAAVALLVENVSFILAGAIGAALVLGMTGGFGSSRPMLITILLVIGAGLVVVHPRVWGGLARVVLRRLGRPQIEPGLDYRRSLLLVVCYVGSWMVLGGGIMVWAMAFVPLPVVTGLRVAGLYVIAWSVGYLSMLAPAGVGVREGIMMAGLAASLPPDAVVVITISLRVYVTAIDLAGALLSAVAAPALVRGALDMDQGDRA